MFSESIRRITLAISLSAGVLGIVLAFNIMPSTQESLQQEKEIAATSSDLQDKYAEYLLMAEQAVSDVSVVDKNDNVRKGQGATGIVVAEISTDKITMPKGSTMRLNATLSYAAYSSGLPAVTIVMPGKSMDSIIIENSVISDLGEKRLNKIIEKKTRMPGFVYTNDFTAYSPGRIVLEANQTKIVDMTITIPAAWPDSMTSMPLSFSLTFDIVEEGQGVVGQNDEMSVTIVPKGKVK